MIVTYRQPKDEAAFMDHYRNRHVPMARKLPGLVSYVINQGGISAGPGTETPFLVGVLTFESMAMLRTAFESDVGRACTEDRQVLAPGEGDSTMLIFEEEELVEPSLARDDGGAKLPDPAAARSR